MVAEAVHRRCEPNCGDPRSTFRQQLRGCFRFLGPPDPGRSFSVAPRGNPDKPDRKKLTTGERVGAGHRGKCLSRVGVKDPTCHGRGPASPAGRPSGERTCREILFGTASRTLVMPLAKETAFRSCDALFCCWRVLGRGARPSGPAIHRRMCVYMQCISG